MCLLGPVRIVTSTDAMVATRFGGAQVAAAAAFLVLAEGGWVSRDRLAEAVWGESVPTSWQAALRNIISRVRTWLGAAGLDGSTVLQTGNGGWTLVLPAATTFDLTAAYRAVRLAESALAQGSPERAWRLAGRAARALGQPLLTESDAFWADEARNQALQWRLRSLDVAADGCLALGDWPAAVTAAAEAIELDPYREASHRRLITAHDRGGDRAAALRAYERCRRSLAEDLGLNPAVETEMTYFCALGPDAPPFPTKPEARTSAPPSALPETDHTVGREEELARFGRLDRVARFARRQIVIVSGPAGIGKTHLALRFAELQVATGRTVLFGRAPRTRVPYGLFMDALTRFTRSFDHGSIQEVLGWTAPVLTDIVGIRREPSASKTSEIAPWEYHSAFLDAFRRLTELGPVLLVADDLARCDDTSLDLLRTLCEQNLSGLLVIGTVRSGEPLPPALDDLLELLARDGGLRQLSLDPLSEEAVAAIAAERLGVSQVDPRLLDLLTAQADGNPLLVTQLLDLLAESEVLDPASGMLDRAAITGLGLPKGTTDVVRHRLRGLAPVALRVAHLVAVFGDEMALDILQDLAADGVEPLLDAIDNLCAADLLVVDADRPGSVRFRHALIAAAVREDLSVTRRAHLHRSIGLRLLALTDQGEPMGASAAEHLRLAGELAPAESRCRAHLEAGRSALAMSALGETLEHLLAATDDLAAVTLPVQADVWCTLGDAHRIRFERQPAMDAYVRALALARAIGHDGLVVRAIDGLASGGGIGESVSPDLNARSELLREGLAAVGDQDSVERIRLLSNYAMARFGEVEGRSAETEAVAMAHRMRNASAFAAALAAQRQLEAGPAHIQGRRRYLEQLVALHGPHLPGETAVRVEQGHLLDAIESGHRAETDRALGALIEQANHLGRPYQKWWAATWKVTVAIIDGDLILAEKQAEMARALAIAPVDNLTDITYGASVIGMRFLQGREVEMVGVLTDVVASVWDLPVARLGLACAQARNGDRSSAKTGYDHQISNDIVHAVTGAEWSVVMYFLTQLAQLLGDREGADSLTAVLASQPRAMVVFSGAGGSGGPFFGSIAQQLGDLAALTGRWEEACQHFETALADHRSFRAPIFVALSAHSLAAALEQCSGNRTRVAALRAEARAAATHLGVALREPGTGQLTDNHPQ
jgi:DNA-binding SARP family transcriptional activator